MAKDGERSAASVLLELLDIVPDVAKLERMLEPANLLRILLARGRDKDDIRAALKTRNPGELLLEVLRQEEDPEALLALCTAPAPPRGAPAFPSAPAAAAAPPFGAPAFPSAPAAAAVEPFGEVSTLNKVASFALLFVVIIPAMIVAGFFPEWQRLSLVEWFAIATVGAAVAGVGYVQGRAPWYVDALGGALVAPGALLAIDLYTRERTTVLRIELALAFFLGAAPGFVAYYALFKKVASSRSGPPR